MSRKSICIRQVFFINIFCNYFLIIASLKNKKTWVSNTNRGIEINYKNIVRNNIVEKCKKRSVFTFFV